MPPLSDEQVEQFITEHPTTAYVELSYLLAEIWSI